MARTCISQAVLVSRSCQQIRKCGVGGGDTVSSAKTPYLASLFFLCSQSMFQADLFMRMGFRRRPSETINAAERNAKGNNAPAISAI